MPMGLHIRYESLIGFAALAAITTIEITRETGFAKLIRTGLPYITISMHTLAAHSRNAASFHRGCVHANAFRALARSSDALVANLLVACFLLGAAGEAKRWRREILTCSHEEVMKHGQRLVIAPECLKLAENAMKVPFRTIHPRLPRGAEVTAS